jgi:N-sulfoglucosamine sulfohydrolase
VESGSARACLAALEDPDLEDDLSRPNVLLISCHDLGQHLGCYGIGTVRTPNIDKFAAEGVLFENSFCAAPQCSPSRAAICTGRYPHSNGVMGLTHGNFAWDLKPGEKPLARILLNAGYQTALIGLQHETRQPDRLGFDRVILGPGKKSCSQVARDAIDYLRAAAKQSSPFFLQLGFFEPHRPFDYGGAVPDSEMGISVPPFLVDDPSSREEFAAFQGAIRAVDSAIGEVLSAVDGVGLRENTITIFYTDHGIPFPRAKCSLYDPGIRVCFIVQCRCCAQTSHARQEAMISNVDYLPTLLELLDISVPRGIHGRSFAPLLRGEKYSRREEIFAEMTYHNYYDPRRCIRTRTHKLIVNFCSAPSFMDPSQSWRPKSVTVYPQDPAYSFHEPLELYDLTTDPLETVNLAGAPEHASIRDELLHRLYAWMNETGDPLLKGVPLSPMHLTALNALQCGQLDRS